MKEVFEKLEEFKLLFSSLFEIDADFSKRPIEELQDYFYLNYQFCYRYMRDNKLDDLITSIKIELYSDSKYSYKFEQIISECLEIGFLLKIYNTNSPSPKIKHPTTLKLISGYIKNSGQYNISDRHYIQMDDFHYLQSPGYFFQYMIHIFSTFDNGIRVIYNNVNSIKSKQTNNSIFKDEEFLERVLKDVQLKECFNEIDFIELRLLFQGNNLSGKKLNFNSNMKRLANLFANLHHSKQLNFKFAKEVHSFVIDNFTFGFDCEDFKISCLEQAFKGHSDFYPNVDELLCRDLMEDLPIKKYS